MKKLAIFTLIAASSCLHRINLNNYEECAAYGKVPADRHLIEEDPSFSHSIGLTSDNYFVDNEAQCVEPVTENDKCLVKKYDAGVVSKSDFNSAALLMKNDFIFLGYCAFIAPGVGLYFYYDADREGHIETSIRAEDSVKCSIEVGTTH